ncbi:uncharacterized protein LOC112968421 [Apteryx rowi]|uniref:uncharacterized protein LOC112968421 n=1 Tax=Apteryx rowi TaxID=308060 RepID=UPI000E1CA3B6|nr:uncharacterized protein LOC112968421 [Apteryx rowi]
MGGEGSCHVFGAMTVTAAGSSAAASPGTAPCTPAKLPGVPGPHAADAMQATAVLGPALPCCLPSLSPPSMSPDPPRGCPATAARRGWRPARASPVCWDLQGAVSPVRRWRMHGAARAASRPGQAWGSPPCRVASPPPSGLPGQRAKAGAPRKSSLSSLASPDLFHPRQPSGCFPGQLRLHERRSEPGNRPTPHGACQSRWSQLRFWGGVSSKPGPVRRGGVGAKGVGTVREEARREAGWEMVCAEAGGCPGSRPWRGAPGIAWCCQPRGTGTWEATAHARTARSRQPLLKGGRCLRLHGLGGGAHQWVTQGARGPFPRGGEGASTGSLGQGARKALMLSGKGGFLYFDDNFPVFAAVSFLVSSSPSPELLRVVDTTIVF